MRTAIHDFEGDQTYSEKRGHNFALNATFDEVRPEDYDALVIPGGRAPEYLRLNPRVLEIVRHFADSGKPIAAICHAAQVLAAAGVLQGQIVQLLSRRGAGCHRSRRNLLEIGIDQAYTCGNLVTAPAWPAHPAWLAQFLKVLGTRIEL